MNKKNKLMLGMVLVVIVLMISFGSSAYSRSVSQGTLPGLSVSQSGSLVGSDFSREMCNEAGQDFIIQIAPAGCEPIPVRSDLLEENNVQVYCQLSVTNLNPLIKVEAIEDIKFSGDFPPEVMSVNFHPAKAALGGKGDLNSPIMENIGYVVIGLRRQGNESAMPDFVEGNLTARIRYDIKEAFGVGDANFYLPEMGADEWDDKYKQYGFWNSRGYLRAESIDSDSASISIYDGGNNRLSGANLKKGELSNKLYLPGMGLCTANFQVQLKGVTAPSTRARLKINSEIIEVVDGERFLDNKCKVKDINKHGLVQSVDLQCEEDGRGEENLNLVISPKIKLSVDFNGEINVVEVGLGDKIPGYEIAGNPAKFVYVGYIGQDSKGKKFIIPVVSPKQNKESFMQTTIFKSMPTVVDSVTYSSGNILFDIGSVYYKGLLGLVAGTVNYLGTGGYMAGWIYEEDANAESPIDFEQLLDSLDFVQNNIKFIGYASPFDELLPSDKNMIEAYEKAIEDYDKVIGSYAGEKELGSIEFELGEQAMYNKIDLLLKFNQKQTAVELCEEFKINYFNSEKDIEGLCGDELKIANYELSSSQVLINGKLKEISLERIYEPSVEEYGAVVSMSGFKEGEEGKDGELLEESLVGIKVGVKYPLLGEDYFELISVKEDYIEVKFNVKESLGTKVGSAFSVSGKSTKIRLEEFVTGIGINKYRFFVNQINLENVAKVSVKSNIDNVGSESTFKFKIGIEKRNIQLSPEKINKRIEKLDGAINKLEGITTGLGQVVEAGKTACLATGTVLTVKNLINNLRGKGLARQTAMRGAEGWYEFCKNQENNGESVSQEKCLLNNSEIIEQDVSAIEVKMNEIDGQYKIIKDGNKIPSSGVFQKGFNQKGIIEDYSENVIESLNDLNIDEFLNPEDNSENINLNELRASLSYNVWKDGNNYDLEQLKDIKLYLSIREDSSVSDGMKSAANKRLYQIFSDIEIATGDSTERVNWASQLGINPSQMQTISVGKNAKEVPYGGVVLNDGTSVQMITTTSGDKYILLLDDSAGTDILSIKKNEEGKKMIYAGNDINNIGDKILSYFENINIVEGISEIENLYFKKYDSSTYENEFKNYEVIYYETEPYKGFPAIVPFDTENGWYAAMKSTLPVFGNLASYDASARVNSFYLCNVGKNEEQEFFSGIGDDQCAMMNLGTGQPTNQFYGLDSNTAGKLVDDAVEAIQQASVQHENGVSAVSIFGKNIPVGKPAVETPDLQCQDFMSPTDCNLMFNVCDPFFCPSSRCDFDGNYPVRDVIQSGVIGSTMLCLPNYDEGIVVPVCLSGIHAGVDGWNQIMKSYKDCLQTSLETGETVGICDEIYSVYGCEFFWRQAAPLAKLAIPKTVSGILGQNSRGGGEYLNVKDAWERAGNSIDYFKESYAENSFKAFKARSSEEIGSVFCKASVSAVLPTGGSIIDALTKPDSPHQVNGRFDEIPYTTNTNPPISQYKVFYNIYAGSDSGAYYSVYLKPGTSSYYQDTNLIQTIATGYIPIGEYVTETPDKLLPSGYRELCINVNGQEYCGFKEVSTSFAVDYVKDQYLIEQASQENIQSEKECISGTPSNYNLLNPNVQEGIGDYIDPAIYDRNIIRICATKNPGVGTDLQLTAEARWKQVGYCGDQKIKCWLDSKSVEDAIKWDVNDERALKDVSDNYVNILMSEGNYTSDEEFDESILKINNEKDNEEKIKLIDKIIDRVFHNNQKGNLHYIRGNAYADIARKLYDAWEKVEDAKKVKEKEDVINKISDVTISLENDEIENLLEEVYGFQSGETISYLGSLENGEWNGISVDIPLMGKFEQKLWEIWENDKTNFFGKGGVFMSRAFGFKWMQPKTKSLLKEFEEISDNLVKYLIDNNKVSGATQAGELTKELEKNILEFMNEYINNEQLLIRKNYYLSQIDLKEKELKDLKGKLKYETSKAKISTIKTRIELLKQDLELLNKELKEIQFKIDYLSQGYSVSIGVGPPTGGVSVCGGDKITQEFITKLKSISNDLRLEPAEMMAAIDFESGFDSQVSNPNSSATGLIQFMKATSLELDCTNHQATMVGGNIGYVKEIYDMDSIEQLDCVQEYFELSRITQYGELKNSCDLYLAILWPAGISADESDIIISKSSGFYGGNSGLDTNDNGISREEACARVRERVPNCQKLIDGGPIISSGSSTSSITSITSYSYALKMVDSLIAKYRGDTKYSESGEFQNFINELVKMELLDEEEEKEISGEGLFNLEEDLDYVKKLLLEKFNANGSSGVVINKFKILDKVRQTPIVNKDVEVTSEPIEVEVVNQDIISINVDSTLRYIEPVSTNIEEKVIVTECVSEPIEICKILKKVGTDSSKFEIQTIIPEDKLRLKVDTTTISNVIDTLTIQTLTKVITDSLGEITIDSTAQILRILDKDSLLPIENIEVSVFDSSGALIEVAQTDSSGSIDIITIPDYFDEEILIYSSSNKIFMLSPHSDWTNFLPDIEIGVRENSLSRVSTINSFAFNEGILYDGNSNGKIYETLTGNVIAERNSPIDALISHNGKLYDGNFNGKIYETLTGNVIAERNSPIDALISHNGKLYDAGGDNKIYETLTGNVIAERDYPILILTSHNGKLYDAGGDNKIYETLTGNVIAERNSPIDVLISDGENLIDIEGNRNQLYKTLLAEENEILSRGYSGIRNEIKSSIFYKDRIYYGNNKGEIVDPRTAGSLGFLTSQAWQQEDSFLLEITAMIVVPYSYAKEHLKDYVNKYLEEYPESLKNKVPDKFLNK